MSVSAPFLMPSVQDAATHTPPLQTPETQSLPALQCLPTAQTGQVPPPQSMSVSAPFLMPSEQVAAATHTPLLQPPETQSLATLHCWPRAQACQDPPPQSTSVSLPFLMPSVQLGAAMAELKLAHGLELVKPAPGLA